MRGLLSILLLSTIAYAAQPVRAQDRQENARRVLGDMRETERATTDSAREWARERGLPTRIRQSDDRLIELVAVDRGRPIYFASTNQQAAEVTGTRHLHPGRRMNLDLTGAGLQIGIWDEGPVFGTHSELAGRVSFGDTGEESHHATHVAGTLASTGLDAGSRGMAYESQLRSFDWNNDATEMTEEAESGLLLSNHSYSTIAGWYYGDLEADGEQWYWLGNASVSSEEDYGFGWYGVQAVQYDRVGFTNPYLLPVVAAGNDRLDRGPSSGTYRAIDASGDYQTYDVSQRRIPEDGGRDGYDTIAGGGVSKNVLTIGSIGFSTIGGSPRVSSFSSFGPTDDGRIKPDLVGLGENLYSLSSQGPTSYARSSGTSMATPNIAGSLLLLQQQYEETYGEFMLASSLKGLALHTATDIGRPGPDFETGWGLLNTEAASVQISESMTNPAGLLESELRDGDVFGQSLVVQHPGPVRITISWTDPPSVRRPLVGPSSLDNPEPHLRNDLDIRLTNVASGELYLPYTLDPTRLAQNARTGDNVVDPIEQIFVAVVDTGAYTLTVSHKGALYGGYSQWYSLLVTGAVDDSAPVGVSHLDADVSMDGVILTWKTLFERSTGSFVIERAPISPAVGKSESDDEFVAVGEISTRDGEGTEYEFTDEYSISGRYVYRLVFTSDAGRYVAARTEVNLPPPDQYAILTNYPNPFQDGTTIEVDLPKLQHVRVEIYDVLGRQLVQLHDGDLPAGRHRFPVDAASWPAGVYFAHIDTPNGVATHQMVLVR